MTQENLNNNKPYHPDPEQLKQQHQEILAREAQAQGQPAKDQLRQQRLDIEARLENINEAMCKDYGKIAKAKAKPTPYLKNLLWAFGVGGIICTIGQGLMLWFQGMGLDEKVAGAAVTSTLITASGLLTGLGIYDEIGRRAGAGSIVPVTGFANSMVSAALEFKKEGWIYGVGVKLFTVAGPVIVYGTLVSAIIGLAYFWGT